MADFRKSLLLAAMSLAIGVGTASAQTGSCTGTTGAPPNLRSQGETELTGQIVINCTGIPTASNININYVLAATTLITSRPDEAYAIITTGPQGAPALSSFVYGTVPPPQSSIVAFNGLAIPTGDFTLTIGGIRANVTNVSTGPQTNSVVAALSISNGSLPLQTTLFTVGYVLPGFTLSPSILGISGASACSTAPTTVALGTGTTTLSIAENILFPTAFKTQFSQIAGQDSETGPYVNNAAIPNLVGGPVIQPASTGTILQLTFTGITGGLQFYIPTTVSAVQAANFGVLVNGTLTLVTGPTNPVPASANIIVDPAGLPLGNYIAVTGDASVYYEITATDPTQVEAYNIPVYPTGPLSGAPSVTVELAPQGTIVQSSSTTPIPTFNATPIGGAFGLTPTQGSSQPCQTSLLFPFVTNQFGFDTGISIAFTGNDPFGTAATTTGGTTTNPPSCVLYYYSNPTFSESGTTLTPGTPAVANTTIDIPVGGENHFTASDPTFGQPNFQGYVIAVCNFQYAHGFAFITDGFGGTPTLAEGYLPLVIGDTRGVPYTTSQPSTYVNGLTVPESLSH